MLASRACLHAADATASKQPNIVFILVDDLPWFGTPVRMAANLPVSAIVTGDPKLLQFYEWPDDSFLYNLTSDLGERHHLAKTQPEVAARMQQDLMARLKAVGGYFPKPNPKARRYDPNHLADPGEGGDLEAGR